MGTFFEKKLLFSNSLLGYSWQIGVLSAANLFCFLRQFFGIQRKGKCPSVVF